MTISLKLWTYLNHLWWGSKGKLLFYLRLWWCFILFITDGFFTFCKSCLNESALQAVRSLIGCNALVFIKDKFQRKLNLFVIPWLKLVVNTKKCELWHQKFDKGLEILWWWIFNTSRRTPLMLYESILLWSGLWGVVLLKPWTTLFAFGDFGGEANGAMFFGYEFELDYLESIHLNLNYQDWTE